MSIVKFSDDQRDIFVEIINIGIGHAANSLYEMTGSQVEINIPQAYFMKRAEFLDTKVEKQTSSVKLNISGSYVGSAVLSFSAESARNLVNALVEASEDDSFDSLKEATLMEVSNIVLSSVMGTISNTLNKQFNYSMPTYYESDLDRVITHEEGVEDMDAFVLVCNTNFRTKNFDINSEIYLVFDLNSSIKLLEDIEYIYGEESHAS